MVEIPKNYQLNKIAERVALRMNLGLNEAQGKDGNFFESIMSFSNPTSHLLQLAIRRGKVLDEVILIGELGNESLIHYAGAISSDTEKPIESLYITDSKKVIAVTWGFPEDVGVLEITDVIGSIALQELSGISRGMGGRAGVVSNIDAPQPCAYSGVSQFREDDFDKLYSTIDTLLK